MPVFSRSLDPDCVKTRRLPANGELVRQRYGNHFQVVLRDLESDDLRVLDFDGQRAFCHFHLSELGAPILYEG